MFENDTICAVSTPSGEGGIGIIRVSGRDAVDAAARIFRPKGGVDIRSAKSHRIHYGHIVDPESGESVDEVLLSAMRAPATYTREDVVEINCHGGMAPLWRTVRLLLAGGARQAEPGEFTKRAFLNGRIDLAQAEAVMDIIRARTEMSLHAANEQLRGGLSERIKAVREQLVGMLAGVEAGVDFPEEEIETPSGGALAGAIARARDDIDSIMRSYAFGRLLREGIAATIVGRPNVGKSSLMNALLQQDRAIVTDIPGTTRDIIEESLTIEGVMVRIIDTAGIRDTHDMVEAEGVKRSLAAIEAADVAIVVLDGSEALHEGDKRVLQAVLGKNTIVVMNKADRPRRIGDEAGLGQAIAVSCSTGEGLDTLRSAIAEMVKQGKTNAAEHAWAVNDRHRIALEKAASSLEKALATAQDRQSPELIAVDLRDALDHIGTIIGATYTEDILERIFSDFCIGK
ncbi:MAG: tRNA uridine-5-carboxymethylaminomethyl(34) synthesis GTPase MnmE [Nitrospirota bacterium]